MKYILLLSTFFCISCQNNKTDSDIANKSDTLVQTSNNKRQFEWKENEPSYLPTNAAEEEFILNKLNTKEMVTDAKWRMYCLYCLAKCQFSDTTTHLYALYDTISFAELELKIHSIINMKHLKEQYIPSGDYGMDLYFQLPQLSHLPKWHHVMLPEHTDVYRCNTIDCFLDQSLIMLQYRKKVPDKPYVLTAYHRNDMMEEVCLLYNNAKAVHFWEAPDPAVNTRITEPLTPEVVDFIKRNADKIHPWFYNEAVRRGVIDSMYYKRK